MPVKQVVSAARILREKAHVLLTPLDLAKDGDMYLSTMIETREVIRAIDVASRDLQHIGSSDDLRSLRTITPENSAFYYQAPLREILCVERVSDVDRPIHLRSHNSGSASESVSLGHAITSGDLPMANDLWKRWADRVKDRLREKDDIADEIWIEPGSPKIVIEGVSLAEEMNAMERWAVQSRGRKQTQRLIGARLALSEGFSDKVPVCPWVPIVPPPEWVSGRIPEMVMVATLLDLAVEGLGVTPPPIRWFFRPRSLMRVQE